MVAPAYARGLLSRPEDDEGLLAAHLGNQPRGAMPAPSVPTAAAGPQEPPPIDMEEVARALESRVRPPAATDAQPVQPDAQQAQGTAQPLGMWEQDQRRLDTASQRLDKAQDVNAGERMLHVLQGALEGGKHYSGPAWEGRQDRAQRDVELARKRLYESQDRDPQSPRSQRLRQAIAPLAEAAGIETDVLDSMAAADFGEIKDVGTIISTLQQRQAQMQHQRDMELQKRQLKLQDRDEERAYKEGRFEEELGARSEAAMDRFVQQHPYRLQRAHAVAGNRADVMREMIHLRDQLEDQDRLEKYEEQATRPLSRTEFEAKVEKLGDKLQSSGVPAMQANLAELKVAMEEARRANNGNIFTLEDEIIRRAGPDEAVGLMSEPARRVMQTWQKVMNAQIKDEAGAAVARQEMERQKVAFGKGIFWNEDDFVRGIENLSRASNAAMENYGAAAGPEIWDEYQRRLQGFRERGAQGEGGQAGQPARQSPRRRTAPTQQAAQQPQDGRVTVTNPQTGETFRIDPSDVQAAQQDGFQVVQ